MEAGDDRADSPTRARAPCELTLPVDRRGVSRALDLFVAAGEGFSKKKRELRVSSLAAAGKQRTGQSRVSQKRELSLNALRCLLTPWPGPRCDDRQQLVHQTREPGVNRGSTNSSLVPDPVLMRWPGQHGAGSPKA